MCKNHLLLYFSLLFILASCKENKRDTPKDIIIAPAPEPVKIEEAPVNPDIAPIEKPIVKPITIETSPTIMPTPAFNGGGGSGGGGGGGSNVRIGERKNKCVCNDNNPCTVDSCLNGECIHTLDLTKTEIGSCEVDNDACTVGKCVNYEGGVFCFEQNRAFIEGEFGCNDGNQCTADSCIELSHKKDYECVNELLENIPCFLEDQCRLGVCSLTGTGSPESEFAITCIENTSSLPQLFCPDVDNNPCTDEICTVGVGCTPQNAPSGTICNDGNLCTLEDSCNGAGLCVGGTSLVCPDNNSDDCSIPTCDATAGCIFENALEDTPCEDGNICTLEDSCNDAGVCIAGEDATCPSDGNPCTAETCDPDLGCTYPAGNDDAPCDDNNACTTGETCLGGLCDNTTATDVTCVSDDDLCTEEVCLAIGGCTSIPIAGPVLCATGLLGICATGVMNCDEEEPVCIAFLPGPEIPCNGIDEDCDGEDSQDCRRAFMTSQDYNGNLVGAANNNDFCDPGEDDNPYSPGVYSGEGALHGVKAADCLCQSHADAANLLCPGTGDVSCWKAWIADSNPNSAPASRFNMSTTGTNFAIYEVNIDGTADLNAPIAVGGWDDLILCDEELGNCLDDPVIGSIDVETQGILSWKIQTGERLDDSIFINVKNTWTNVDFDGTVTNMTATDGSCDNWGTLSTGDNGEHGIGFVRDITWTLDDDTSPTPCTTRSFLYCFEDF